MIVISIQEAVGTGGVMVEDHDIGAVGGIGRGIGIVGHGIDIPAVVGIYLGVLPSTSVYSEMRFIIKKERSSKLNSSFFACTLFFKKGF